MGMTDEQIRIAANIIKKEGVSTDPQEYLWLAHTANNQAKVKGKTLYEILMTGYSSVGKGDKVELSDKDQSVTAKAARDAVNDVANGGVDPTDGARFWDGTDFLAWGLKSPDGTPHNKFEEYAAITILAPIFDTFLAANKAKYGDSVRYGKTSYTLPAEVFNDQKNWYPIIVFPVPIPARAVGFFRYTTGKGGKELVATGSFGLSIFWKIV